jgi:hypothetical protein
VAENPRGIGEGPQKRGKKRMRRGRNLDEDERRSWSTSTSTVRRGGLSTSTI